MDHDKVTAIIGNVVIGAIALVFVCLLLRVCLWILGVHL